MPDGDDLDLDDQRPCGSLREAEVYLRHQIAEELGARGIHGPWEISVRSPDSTSTDVSIRSAPPLSSSVARLGELSRSRIRECAKLVAGEYEAVLDDHSGPRPTRE